MIKDFFKCDHAGRMTGDKRREQILQTAVNLFSRRGFNGTTTKEIARAAGVSEAMVFRHFATKHELYHAILDFKACEGGMKSPPWEDERERQGDGREVAPGVVGPSAGADARLLAGRSAAGMA